MLRRSAADWLDGPHLSLQIAACVSLSSVKSRKQVLSHLKPTILVVRQQCSSST